MAPKILFIAEIGLRVADLKTMTRFYTEVMGFEVHLEGEKYIFLQIADLPSPLGEIGHPQLLALFDRDYTPEIPVTSLDHLAFEVSPADYDAELENFQSKGMVIMERRWPESLDWRARSFFFRDPEGNVLEIVAADPGLSG